MLMDYSVIAIVISLVGLAFSIFFSVKNGHHTDSKDVAEKVATQTRMEVKLDDVCNTTKNIQVDVKGLVKDINEHSKDIAELKASYKSLHKRIDRDERIVAERLEVKIINEEEF